MIRLQLKLTHWLRYKKLRELKEQVGDIGLGSCHDKVIAHITHCQKKKRGRKKKPGSSRTSRTWSRSSTFCVRPRSRKPTCPTRKSIFPGESGKPLTVKVSRRAKTKASSKCWNRCKATNVDKWESNRLAAISFIEREQQNHGNDKNTIK